MSLVDTFVKTAAIHSAAVNPDVSGVCMHCGKAVLPPKKYCNHKCAAAYREQKEKATS